MEEKLTNYSEELVNLVNFLTLNDNIDLDDTFLIDDNLDVRFRVIDSEDKLISISDEDNTLNINLYRNKTINNVKYAGTDGTIEVIGFSYENLLSISFINKEKSSTLSLDYNLSYKSDDPESFIPVDSSFIINNPRIIYTTNRPVLIKNTVHVPIPKEERTTKNIYKTFVDPETGEKFKVLVRKANERFKTVTQTKKDTLNFQYEVSSDLNKIYSINKRLLNNFRIINEDKIDIQKEVQDLVNDIPFFSHEVLNTVVNKLLKDYHIAPVKELAKTPKMSYEEIMNIRFK